MRDLDRITHEQRPTRRSMNPILLTLGFVFLGAAAAFILFGSDLFSPDRRPSAAVDEIDSGVLADVSELEVGDTIVAEMPDAAGTLMVGDAAPDFLAFDLEGNPINLSDFRGRPVIVNFWATWCAPCLVEMPELQAAFEAHEADGLVVLAVNREEDARTVETFFYDELGLTFTPLLDEQAFAANLYGVFNMPSTYFVNGDGVIIAIHRGPLTQGQINGYLKDALSPTG